MQVGDAAPDSALPDQFGQETRLCDAARATLLVFYPFAFSGICTSEMTAIQDDLDAFDNDALRVLAISCDPMFTLRAWAETQGFDFPLLSDFWPHGAVSRAFGVFDDASGMAVRGTFLIDRAGVVRWTLVKGPGESRDLGAIAGAVARHTV